MPDFEGISGVGNCDGVDAAGCSIGGSLIGATCGLAGEFCFGGKSIASGEFCVASVFGLSGAGVAVLVFFGALGLSFILAWQCGQAIDASPGSRTNENRCLHFGQTPDFFFAGPDSGMWSIEIRKIGGLGNKTPNVPVS
jgi:hypothetical protein